MRKIIENLAISTSSQHSARHDPLPIGIGIGSRLGLPSDTQGSPMRHARETQGSIGTSTFVCNKIGKMTGGGRTGLPKSPGIAKECQKSGDRFRSPSGSDLLVCGRNCEATWPEAVPYCMAFPSTSILWTSPSFSSRMPASTLLMSPTTTQTR
jgi:hypothetical protein